MSGNIHFLARILSEANHNLVINDVEAIVQHAH